MRRRNQTETLDRKLGIYSYKSRAMVRDGIVGYHNNKVKIVRFTLQDFLEATEKYFNERMSK